MAKGVVLVPKRKLTFIPDRNETTVLIQHIQQNTPPSWTGLYSVVMSRLWVTDRLRIPVGNDMYDTT